MPAPDCQVDVLIFGGGIAGLWTFARLAREGYSCLLLESRSLGAGQTIASQGIIHGGIKYALTGEASRASRAIAEMPALWQACLAGRGEVDLSSAAVLSTHQHLWTTAGIGSRLVGVAASKAIRTEVSRIAADERPAAFAAAPRSVDLYRVDEPVLDPASVLRALAAPGLGRMALCRSISRTTFHSGGAITITAALATSLGSHPGVECRINARAVVLAAGEGNASLLERFAPGGAHAPRPAQQLRPLHMVMARAPLDAPQPPALYGHCVGLTDKPRLTITTQRDSRARTVWYIGGQISERGVSSSPAALIDETRRELAACVPWVPLDGFQWSTLRVNRAEGLSPAGARPDEPVVHACAGVITLWPTKLAFAPLAAALVLERLRAQGVEPAGCAAALPDGLLTPPVAPLPWEQEDRQWT